MDAQQSVRDGSDIGQAQAPRVGVWSLSGEPFVSAWDAGLAVPTECDQRGHHRLRVKGYLLGPRPVWLDCARPLQVVCVDCDYETRWACSGHRESRCKPCAARYRRRVRSVAESGTRRTSGWQYLLTCTAPGREAHRMPSGDWCPCTPPGGVDLAAWNASHSRRWNHLRTRLRRLVPGLEFFRGVEVQKRGALHDHAMVWSPKPLSVKVIRELALAAGFGHSVDLAPAPSGSKQAAYYVSKYVTKATDSREDVPWLAAGHVLEADEGGHLVDVDTLTGETRPARASYRTWSCSRQWGLTMAAVRSECALVAAELRRELEMRQMSEFVAGLGDVLLPDETPPAPS